MKPRHQPEQVEYGPMHPDLFDGETPIVWVSGAAEQPATEPRKVRGGGGSMMHASANGARRP